MKLIVMSFDGDYTVEHGGFKTVSEAWEWSNNMGSRWFFYPFHFVTSASGKTIKDASELLDWTVGQRVTTVQKVFDRVSGFPEAKDADVDKFTYLLWREVAQD